MLVLILFLILSTVTIFSALLESFYSPEALGQMGVHLEYSPTGKSTGNPEPCQEKLSRT